ncbi:structural protein [Cellulophaga phage phi14:2]|nr:structural protein [Cellulophaga phage phi14:2]
MSMQEIFSVPLAKQAKHEQLMMEADNLGLFDVQALDKDKSLVSDYKNEFEGKLNGITDEVTKNGINNISKQKLKALASERNKWLTSGQGKDVSSNYNAYVANKEELDKMYQTGKISRDKYQSGISRALSQYQGVANKGQYQAFNAVHDTDFQEKATKVAAAMQNNPTKIAGFSGLQYDARTGKYLDVKTKREYTQPDAIRQAVKASLMMDMDVMSDLNQRQQLGMLGNVDTGTYIDGLGLLNEQIYRVNNVDQTKQYTGIDQGQLDSRNPEFNSRNYELEPNQRIEMNNNDLIDSLNTITNGENTNFSGIPRIAENSDGSIKRDPLTGEAIYLADGEKATYDNMDRKSKAQYDLIYDKMNRQGTLKGSKKDISSIKTIQKYLESTKNVGFQQIKYTDGLMKTYEGRTSKFKRTDPKVIADGISNNPENRIFIDKESGKEMQYDDLPNSVKEEMDKRQGTITSVYSSRNFLTKEYSTLKPDVTAGMLEMQFSGNKKYLVSRSKSERSTPSYQASVKMNEIWSDTNMTPGLTNNFQIPKLGNIEVIKQLDGTIEVSNKSGKEIFNSDDELELFINDAYNVQ